MTARLAAAFVGGALATLLVALPVQAGPPDRDVRVVNQPAEPVPVVNVAGGPANGAIHIHQEISIPDSAVSRSAAAFPVPAGKRLVVEHISVISNLPAGQTPRIFVSGVVGGVTATVVPETHLAASGFGRDQFDGSQEARLYVDHESPLGFAVQRWGGSAGDANFVVDVVGYLVDQ